MNKGGLVETTWGTYGSLLLTSLFKHIQLKMWLWCKISIKNLA